MHFSSGTIANHVTMQIRFVFIIFITIFFMPRGLELTSGAVVNACRKHIARYYEHWLVCSDPTCKVRTKTDYKLGSKGTVKCRAKRNGTPCNSVMRSEVCSTSMPSLGSAFASSG